MSRQPVAPAPRGGRRCVRFAMLALSALWLLIPGCTSTQSRARQESTARWNRARAQVKLKLASDHLGAGHVEDAATELAAAIRLDPAHPALETLHARVCLARGDLAGAERLLENALAKDELRGEVEYLLGIIAEQRLQWAPALEHYVRAAAANPQEVAYVVAMVQVMLQQGQAEDALALLESYEPQFGWTGAYHAARAECCEQLEDWSGAAAAWRTVADGRDDPDLSERLAVALYRAGDRLEAVRLFEQLLDQAAAQPKPHLRLALAECLLEEGRPAAAHQHVGLILRDDPRSVPALQLVARVFAEQGQLRRARQTAERALRFAPDDVRTLELVAALAFRAGDTSRALALAERIIQNVSATDNPIADQILTSLSAATPAVE